MLEQLIQIIPEVRYQNQYAEENEEVTLRGISMDPDIMLYQIQTVLKQFEELNQGQLGKIHDFRLKNLIKQNNVLAERSVTEIEMEKECTFTPIINTKSIEIDQKRQQMQYYNSTKNQQNTQIQLKREDLLHQYGKQIQQKMLKRKEIKDEGEINGLTFRPQISEKSKALANHINSNKDYRSGSRERQIRSPVVKEYLENKDKEYTFQPYLNNNQQRETLKKQ